MKKIQVTKADAVQFRSHTERLARTARGYTITWSRGHDTASRTALPRRLRIDAQIDLWWQADPVFDVVQ